MDWRDCDIQVFSNDDIQGFVDDGFLLLKNAFPEKIANACKDIIWNKLNEGNITMKPDTWVERKGLKHIYQRGDGYPWSETFTPRLGAAVNQLIGKGRWTEFGMGWWTISFPKILPPPWKVTGQWHIDGSHFLHKPDSPEIGLIAIVLFSDVFMHGGGTALVRGSHHNVASILWERSGSKGISGPDLSQIARQEMMPNCDAKDMIETVGTAGDVMFIHPMLLHARSNNLGNFGVESVRVICTPSIPLKAKMNLNLSCLTPVEKVIWQAKTNVRKRSRCIIEESDFQDEFEAEIMEKMGFHMFGKKKKI